MTVFSRALMIACLAFPTVGQAASLRIAPIGVEMTEKQRATSISLTNTDSDPVSLQIRVFKWTQVDGEDVLEPTNEMIVSPPAATVPAGATYTIRVARPSATPVTKELSYRIFVDELPPAVDPDSPNKGVSMVLRTSMPIFVADEKAKPLLAWRIAEVSDGIKVTVMNSGNRNVKITNLKLTDTSGSEIVKSEGLNGYVLAGVERSFTLRAQPDAAPLKLAEGTQVMLSANDRDTDINETLIAGRP